MAPHNGLVTDDAINRLKIVVYMRTHETDTAQGIARRLEIPIASAYRALSDLEDNGYVEVVELRFARLRMFRSTDKGYKVAPSVKAFLESEGVPCLHFAESINKR
jgi:predicted ArsR family transcriptional regulator